LKQLYLSIALLSLAGCSTLSGLDGKSSFSCKAPDGVSCSSLSGVYANATQNNLPGLQVKKAENKEKAKREETAQDQMSPPPLPVVRNMAIAGNAPSSGDPIHAPSKILRVWIAPWEDDDGDLHDQSYVYMMADFGRWVIEHNRRSIMNAYQPVNLSTGSISPEKRESATVEPSQLKNYNLGYDHSTSSTDGLNSQQKQLNRGEINDLEDLD